MANGTSISEFKERIMDAITQDDTIFYAFDAKECENGGDLENTRIFNYNKIPETVKEANTYMTIMVRNRVRDRNGTFVTPTLTIWIYSHFEHMKMDYKITKDNRNDYIARLLDEKFNGSTEYGGIGKLILVDNDEGTYNDKFLYRRLVFETVDINDSFCDGW